MNIESVKSDILEEFKSLDKNLGQIKTKKKEENTEEKIKSVLISIFDENKNHFEEKNNKTKKIDIIDSNIQNLYTYYHNPKLMISGYNTTTSEKYNEEIHKFIKENIDKRIENLSSLLNNPLSKQIKNKFEALKSKNTKDINEYSYLLNDIADKLLSEKNNKEIKKLKQLEKEITEEQKIVIKNILASPSAPPPSSQVEHPSLSDSAIQGSDEPPPLEKVDSKDPYTAVVVPLDESTEIQSKRQSKEVVNRAPEAPVPHNPQVEKKMDKVLLKKSQIDFKELSQDIPKIIGQQISKTKLFNIGKHTRDFGARDIRNYAQRLWKKQYKKSENGLPPQVYRRYGIAAVGLFMASGLVKILSLPLTGMLVKNISQAVAYPFYSPAVQKRRIQKRFDALINPKGKSEKEISRHINKFNKLAIHLYNQVYTKIGEPSIIATGTTYYTRYPESKQETKNQILAMSQLQQLKIWYEANKDQLTQNHSDRINDPFKRDNWELTIHDKIRDLNTLLKTYKK